MLLVVFRSPCRSLWVGNVTTELTEKHLWDLFKAYDPDAVSNNCRCSEQKKVLVEASPEWLGLRRRCGDIESIRVLHERFCAFVNFKSADAAAHAMEKLNVSPNFL